MNAEALAELQRYLRRIFPKRGVNVGLYDYENLVNVKFVVEDDAGATTVRGIVINPFNASAEWGRRELAGKLLRTAYPRGWAVP